MISVVVPCYNIENYIEKTIKSVLNQTYSDYELLLVNDGSTDKTLKFLKKYENLDKRINIIDKKNGGVSSARNSGIEKSKGEYIYFLDGDDTIEEDFFEKAINIFNLNREIDILSFGFDIVSEKNEQIKKYSFKKYDKKVFDSEDFLNKYFLKKIRQNMCSFIAKREIIIKNNIKFSEGIAYGEDQEFQIKTIFNSKKIYYDEKCYFHYLKRENSAVNEKIKLKRLDLIKIFIEIKKNLQEKSNNKTLLTNLNNYVGNIFFFLFREGKRKGGDEEYFGSLYEYDFILEDASLNFSKYGIVLYVLSKLYFINKKIFKKII